ncbi:hypothetical protein ACG02S_10190 [Roseateles sp. DC23W]|uniref:Uncharacterized protein n=1 Tax=Pelomonas dachongensis TaxID=3299029 RepID=A0ABW7ELF7_9BURK
MAIYASSQARGTERVDVVTLGAISVPQPAFTPGQLFVAQAARPAKGQRQPIAVHSSTSVPSGQRT